MPLGTYRRPLSSFRKNRFAAFVSRRFCTRMSSTSPLLSTAPQIDELAVDLAEHLIEMPDVPGRTVGDGAVLHTRLRTAGTKASGAATSYFGRCVMGLAQRKAKLPLLRGSVKSVGQNALQCVTAPPDGTAGNRQNPTGFTTPQDGRALYAASRTWS
jgi:hypothetical protein